MRLTPLLVLLAACAAEDVEPLPECPADIVVLHDLTLSEHVPTVATLDVTIDGPADVRVTLTADGAPTVVPPVWEALDGPVSLPLYGLRPDTTYTARVVTDRGDSCGAAEIDVSTGSLPAYLPPTEVTEGDESGGYVLLGWIDTEDQENTGAMVLDPGGAIVWYWNAPRGVAANPTWDADGTDVLIRTEDRAAADDSAIYRISATGEVVSERAFAYAHHALGQAPGIDFAYLRAVSAEVDGETVTGDEIVEVAEDGTERVVWNAFACLPEVEPHAQWSTDTAPIPGIDWTHTNGLSYCAADDTWLISTYYLHEIHKIRRSDCSSVWSIDGDGELRAGGLLLSDSEAYFGPQHGPECTDFGLVLFDNGKGVVNASRALALDVYPEEGVATLRWSSPHPEGEHTPLLGDASLTTDGRVAVAWGILGEVSLHDAEGASTWRVHLDRSIIGKASWRESLYGP